MSQRRRIPLEERFWAKVHKTDSCWLWTATKHPQGYGSIRCETEGQWVKGKAHRISWELHNGPIPAGMHVLHHCDNPPCVNPAHLFLGTNDDNIADMAAKGRRRGPRGERCILTKLTVEKVIAIRAEYAAGATQQALGEKYGVATNTVHYVVTRKTWHYV